MDIRVPLSDDMLINILLYLPVKSVLRFRCISKYWYALVKSSTFLIRHLKRDSKKILLLKRYLPPQNINEYQPNGDDILSFHDLDCPELLVLPNLFIPSFNEITARDQIALLGPCNGLVCLQNYKVIVFCNPALREFKVIDPTPFAFPEHHAPTNQGSGFGFDVITNDYKFIQMWDIIDNRDDHAMDSFTRVDLYNLSTNSWRLIDVKVPPVGFDPGFELFFNGACHWNASEHIEGPPPMGTILSFDVRSEFFQKFEYPDNELDDWKSSSLAILNECLALVRYYAGWGEDLHPVDIWMMKEYGVTESWTKELVIAPYFFKSSLLCWRNEWLLVETLDNQLAYCAIHENEMNRFQYYGFQNSFRACIFTESLISLIR